MYIVLCFVKGYSIWTCRLPFLCIKDKLKYSDVKIKLENSNNRNIFGEGTYDMFWGTGLDIEATLHTDSRKWPGENRLGKIYKKLSSKYARKLRNSSVPRKGTANENQSNIDVFLKDLKKGGKKNGKSDSG